MAKFKPGQSGNPTGRPKGIVNEKIQQWEKFREFMMNAGLERFEMEMQTLEGKEYVNTMISLMEYFQPKLARVENTGEGGGPIKLEVVSYQKQPK